MSCKLAYSRDASEQLKCLDRQVQIRILKKILCLRGNPALGKPLSNALKNKRSLHIGKYRVVYSVLGQDVIIARIGHRKDVYI